MVVGLRKKYNIFLLEYEKKRYVGTRIVQLESTIANLENALRDVKKKKKELEATMETANTEIEDLNEQVEGWKSKAEECGKDIQGWKKKITAATSDISKHNRQIKSKKNLMDQLSLQKQETLEKCEIEDIDIPIIADPMDIDSSAAGPVIDLSSLSRSLQQKTKSSERDKTGSDFTQKIAALVSEIEKTAPNMKALDQYEAVLDKERAASKEWEAARYEQNKITTEYNKIKQKRKELFTDAFNHIESNINKIYNELTKSNVLPVGGASSSHAVGGTARLYLENQDEPFLYGIKYTATPPTKRLQDMPELSGGEKTVAAHALLFAIHSFRPSPFFILDEVDAALDNQNVAKVVRFIRSKSCGGAGIENSNVDFGSTFQSIVISLKDNFYDKAQALVGVFRDSERGCSRTLTFDLTKCRES